MGKCLLCREREATVKGSHIIPSFLMKRINSMDGCNERDHEIGFRIEPGTVTAYFGRDVYEDKRREYTDDESRIDDRTNLDTIDNIFCPQCEKLFSRYESNYSNVYSLTFDKELVDNTKLSGKEAAIFWYTVLWRISVTNQFAVRLNTELEEKLRQILISEDLCAVDLYYALHYCKDYRSNNHPTFALFDTIDNVALLIVDEFMLLLFNGASATQNDNVLWGMNYKGDANKLNTGDKLEQIALFPMDVFQFINDSIIYRCAAQLNLKQKLNQLYYVLYGKEMPKEHFQDILREIHRSKLADLYTIPNYIKAIKRVKETYSITY